MKQLAMVVLAAAMGLWATAVRATDIYVSQSDPAAKDDNPGTLASPLKTIQAGLDKASRRHRPSAGRSLSRERRVQARRIVRPGRVRGRDKTWSRKT